jgi:hypothetical protein
MPWKWSRGEPDRQVLPSGPLVARSSLDEHAFVTACAEAEIPVIAPLRFGDGATLGDAEGIAFALSPNGRSGDRARRSRQRAVGASGGSLARVHSVGACAPAPDRITLGPYTSAAADLDYLIDGGFLDAETARRLEAFGHTLLDAIAPCSMAWRRFDCTATVSTPTCRTSRDGRVSDRFRRHDERSPRAGYLDAAARARL